MRGPTSPPLTATAEQRAAILASIEVRSIPVPEAGCWLWTGAMDNKGYGWIGIQHPSRRASRASYLAFKGDIPANTFVCHRCDTRSCINPDHLFLGDALDNNRDRHAKGRDRHPVGERNGSAKLTAAQVQEIRNAEGSERSLAKRYGVGSATIGRIRRNKNWLTAALTPEGENRA